MKNVLEAEYRRAYRDGWIEATNALADLLEIGVSPQEIYIRLFNHWGKALSEWQDTITGVDIQRDIDVERITPPPDLPIEP